MAAPTISPPRVARRHTGTTRYEKELASTPKLADDPDERKWIGPWLMGETIGKGASGRVRLARHKRTGKLAAIKIIPKLHIGAASRLDSKTQKIMQSIQREMVVMKLIHHPHIMDMYDVYEDDFDLYLLLEYVEGGELFDYLVNKGRLHYLEALSYFKQIISGVDYCHRFNICHRDLKPENLLLDAEKNIKIADFGMAALELDGGTGLLETSCGSPHYASPEVVAGKAYHGAASDIWSCGVVLFALLTGRLPFDHSNMHTLLRMVKLGRYTMPESIPGRAQNLLSKMLVVDPSQRITMPNIISHPFFTMDYAIKVPILAPPPFFSYSEDIISEDHIDRQILENLTTLFRGITQQDIIRSLLSDTKTWEKAFYRLLKDYQERQSEEFGHGMSFSDTTSKEDLSSMSTSRKVGPTGTIKGSQRLSLQARRASLTPPGGKASSKHVSSGHPVASRIAPTPVTSNFRRQRPAPVAGPRPHSVTSSPTLLPPSSPNPARLPASPQITKVTIADSPRITSPRPARANTMPHPPPAQRPSPGTRSTLEQVDHIAYTLEASRPSSLQTSPVLIQQNRIEERLREQRLRNANHLESRRQDGQPPVIGLGLSIPSSLPPSQRPFAVPAPRPASHSRRISNEPLSPRMLPLPPTPNPSSFSPRGQHNWWSRDQQAEATSSNEKPSGESSQTSITITKAPVVDGQTAAIDGYPSPPPSQAGLLEPLLALQQSPIFTDRFSLNLDAMLTSFKPPIDEPGEECEVASPLLLSPPIQQSNMSSNDSLRELHNRIELEIRPVSRHVRDSSVSKPLSSPTVESSAPTHLLPTDQTNVSTPTRNANVVIVSNKTSQKENSPSRRDESDKSVPIPAKKHRPVPLDLNKPKPAMRMSTFVAAPPSPMPTPVLEPVAPRWFAQLFRVKPAAYVFHSRDNCVATRAECADLLRSFGISVKLDASDGYGLLKCHVDYIQEPSGKMIVNKPVKFRAQIMPQQVSSTFTQSAVGSPLLSPKILRSPVVPPSNDGCTLALIQERGAKSTLEVIALRLRQEWTLDSLCSADSPTTPRLPFIN